MHLDQIPVVLDTDSVPIVEVKGRVLVVPSKLSPWHVLGGLRYCLCLVFMCCCPSHSLAVFLPLILAFLGVLFYPPGIVLLWVGGVTVSGFAFKWCHVS